MVVDGRKVLIAQLLKVFIDVLIRKIAAQKCAVDFAVWTCQLAESTLSLALLDELVETLEVETGRWTTDEAIANELEGQRVRLV